MDADRRLEIAQEQRATIIGFLMAIVALQVVMIAVLLWRL